MSTPNDKGVSNAATNAARTTSGTSGSVNVQSIISSIRTIAKTKELEQKVEKLIQAQKSTSLPGLNAERIVAQQAALSAGSSSSSSTVQRDEDKNPGDITDKVGETAADAAQKAAEDALKDGTKNPDSDQSTDKSDQNKSSDGSTETDKDKGIYRVGDLFTDLAPYPSEKGDASAPRIKEIVGEIAGKAVSVFLRELTKWDNTPDGWEDSDTPPLAPGWEGWEQGYWASALSVYVGTAYGHSISDAVMNAVNSTIGYVHPGFNYVIEEFRNLHFSSGDENAQDWTVEFYLNWDGTSSPINTGWYPTTIPGYKLDCGLSNPNEGDNCPVEAPRATEFPLGEILGFGWRDGKWEFHLYDSEGAQILSDNKSVLMMTDGGKGYELGPKQGGGWYAAPTYVIPGTTPAVLIRPDGTIQNYIDRNVLPFYTGAHSQTQNDNGFIGVPHLI